MSAAKAPPRKTMTGSGKGRTSVAVEPTLSTVEKRTNGLLGLAQLGQGLCMATGQYADAAAIGMHFPAIAPELAKVAENAPIIAAPIDFLIEAGPYAALLSVVAPLALQVAANHGWIDASRLYAQGVKPPAVLEAEMQAQVMRMQTAAIKAQQVAMEEAQAAQAEFEDVLAFANKKVA